jgi:hypothetical protein
MAFNLNDYEDVATLNKWFISNFPKGRSDISVISHDAKDGYILVQATLWRDSIDDKPAVSNIAFGSRETYIPNMKKFYVEDTATSALGRAIILLKGSDKTATKDDMKKVDAEPNQYEKKLQERRYGAPGSKSAAVEDALRASFAVENKQDDPQAWSVAEAVDAIGKSTPSEPPVCCDKGHIMKQGISKGGKPYLGYVCKGKIAEHAKWAKVTSQGHFYFEEN